MLTIQTINSPSKGTVDMILRKVKDESIQNRLKGMHYKSLGLIQGPLADMIVAGDIAEKASNVDIAEMAGVCPQHITLVGVFGDTAAVAEALKAVDKWQNSGFKQD